MKVIIIGHIIATILGALVPHWHYAGIMDFDGLDSKL